jgi:transcriptional regulator with XRE-family HTH domain
MKSNQRIRELLGLTQEQLAMLLGVSRSQLSLYELGLRELPTAALQQLAEMLSVVQNVNASIRMKSRAAEEKGQNHVTLQKLLKENSFQQERLTRKIVVMEETYQTNLTGVHLVKHLVSKGEFKLPHQTDLLGVLERRMSRALEKNGYSKIIQHQIKLKVLQQEEKVLREELEKDRD